MMITATDIENFTRECATMFCTFNFPRGVRTITENKFMSIERDNSINYSKCLAYTSPGGVITVIYDRIERIIADRGFCDKENSLAFTICHELSHLEQNLNPILYNNDDSYKSLVEMANDLNTSETILNNIDFYERVMRKYFKAEVDIDTIENIKDNTERYALFKGRYTSIKSIIERDIVLSFVNDEDVLRIKKEMEINDGYTIILNYKNYVSYINISRYRNYHSDFERFESFMKEITDPDINKPKRVRITREFKNNYLCISFTIL